MSAETTFYGDVQKLIDDRYEPLADQARTRGLTMTADYISYLVQVEVMSQLQELSEAMTSPHPRHTSAIMQDESSEGIRA